MLAFGREVEQRGGNEVGSLEDLEVALGGVVALGAVDDGFGCFVPGDFLSEGVDGGDGAEFAVGELQSDAEGVAEGFGGGMEEVGEELAAFAEDAAEVLGDGEDELAVGHFVADGSGDPVAGRADAALVARGAEVADLAGEGEEAFVTAVGALEPGEAGGEIAAAEEGFDGGGGDRVERAEILAVPFFVVGEEFFPAVVDELPEWRGAGAAGLVNGGHKECS